MKDGFCGYYNKPQGLFDRLELISIDDALIAHTEQFGTFGTYPVIRPSRTPSLTSSGKTNPHTSAETSMPTRSACLARKTNLPVSRSPQLRQPSTSLGWYGIFFLAPTLWFVLFWIFDSLCGDTRQSPWGLLVLVLFAHAAPEADVGSIVYMCVYTAFGIVFAAITGAYVMPVLGTLFVGPEGIMLRRGPVIRSVPSRLRPAASSEI